MQEGKRNFSGKHKMYGYKMEVAGLPNGFAAACNSHFPGSDISILMQCLDEIKWMSIIYRTDLQIIGVSWQIRATRVLKSISDAIYRTKSLCVVF